MAGGVRVRLEPLSAAWASQLRQFEEVNRAFFASQVSDRGDMYFEHFEEHLKGLVAEHESGVSLLYLILEENDTVIGRVNIRDINQPDETEVGFRVAERVQGRGVASWGVGVGLEEAARRGVHIVRARAATSNIGSQHVLHRCGFTPTGPAAAPAGSDKSFIGYIKRLG